MQKPLASAVIGGLSFSTLFTLIFAPALFVSMRKSILNRQDAKDARKDEEVEPLTEPV